MDCRRLGPPVASAASRADNLWRAAWLGAVLAVSPPAAIMAAAAPAGAGSGDAPAAGASAAAQLEKYLDGLSAWSADFKQAIEDSRGAVLRSAAGKFYLQRPGRFRWDYVEPSEQLVLSDGKQIWFYDLSLIHI